MRTWAQLMLCAALTLPAVAGQAEQKKTTDTTETAAGKTTTNLTSNDRKFMEKAASGGMAEVKLGQLAMDKATSPTVKEFAKRMVDDHGKANDELKEIATKKNFPMPTDLTTKDKATYDKLAKLTGDSFDKAYMDAMVKDHDTDVKEFQHEAKLTGADPDLKAFAEKTVKVLEEHKSMAHQDKDALKK